MSGMLDVIPAVVDVLERAIKVLENPKPEPIMKLEDENKYVIGKVFHNRLLLDTFDKDVSELEPILSDVVKTSDINIEHVAVTHWSYDHIGSVQDLFALIIKGPSKIEKPQKDNPELPALPSYQVPPSLTLNCPLDGTEVPEFTIRIHHTDQSNKTSHVALSVLADSVEMNGVINTQTSVLNDLIPYLKHLQLTMQLVPRVIYTGVSEIPPGPIQLLEFYNAHKKRKQQIFQAIQNHNTTPLLSKWDIVKTVYSETPEFYFQATESTVYHILRQLMKKKKIIQMEVDSDKRYIVNPNYIPSG